MKFLYKLYRIVNPTFDTRIKLQKQYKWMI